MRQLLTLAVVSALTLSATYSSPAAAQDPCGETFEECLPALTRVVEESLSQSVVEEAIVRAVDDADPANAAFDELSDEVKPKPGTAGELIKAILATDPAKRVLSDLGTPLLDKVKKDWAAMRTTENIALLAFGVVIAAPTVTGVIADPKLL
ncbi:MAG: hypothetical protein RIT28_4220, partial [Pseudomonadota bacterium]